MKNLLSLAAVLALAAVALAEKPRQAPVPPPQAPPVKPEAKAAGAETKPVATLAADGWKVTVNGRHFTVGREETREAAVKLARLAAGDGVAAKATHDCACASCACVAGECGCGMAVPWERAPAPPAASPCAGGRCPTPTTTFRRK